MRIVVKALGIVMIVFATLGFLGLVLGQGKQKASKKDDGAVGGTIVLVAMFGGGVVLVRKSRRMKEIADQQVRALAGPSAEQHTLLAARKHRGRLTAVQVAADTGLTVDQAREDLERLAKNNACLMDIEEDGRIVFRFPEFATSDDKPVP